MVLLCWLLTACDTDVEAGDEAQQPPGDDGSDVAAVVNDHEISHREVDRHLDKLGQLYRHSNRRFDESTRQDKRRRVLDRLIDRQLLHEYADSRDVDVDTDTVDRTLQRRIDAQFGSADDFRRYLDNLDITVSEYRDRIRRDLAIEELIGADVDAHAVDEDRLQRYYERIANRRPADERVHAGRLSIDMRGIEGDDQYRAIRQLLHDELEDIDSSDELRDLGDQVKQWGEQQNLEISHRFREPIWYERRRLRPHVAQQLFEADEDSAALVDTASGIDAYWLHEVRPEGIRQFDEVEELLRERARRSRLSEQRQELIDELRRDAQITTDLEDSPPTTDPGEP